ncbi:MAG: hypothetical protein QOD47_2755 [Gemmatimonadaceae bacterium]|jgi:FlaG/FlaF family flagellin (archaellin)|nr:hypothetical protein [Gemmatimonadaceae bacterium]
MPPGVVIIAIVAVLAGTMSSVLKMWLSRAGRTAIPQAELKEIRDGIGQLQQAVDAIAIEVERLSEGQRFTTKLLSDQAQSVAQIPPTIAGG